MAEQKQGGAQPPTEMQGTAAQRMIVFVLVIAVGVLFGMGGSMALLQGGQGRVEIGLGVDQVEHRKHMDMMTATMSMEYNMQVTERDMSWVSQRALNEVALSKLADQEGLLPRGEARQQLLKNYVNQPLRYDPGRKILDAIDDRRGSEQAIDIESLAEFLAVQQASNAFSTRYIPTPIVGLDTAADFMRSNERIGDKVAMKELQLSAERFLPELEVEVEADEEAIKQAYEDLKFQRFEVPESIRVLAVVADPADIISKIAIADEAVKERYESTKAEKYLLPAEPVAEGEEETPAEPRYRPFDEVREVILADMKQKAADAVAAKLIALADKTLSNDGLANIEADWDSFRKSVTGISIKPDDQNKLTAAVSPTVHEKVRVMPAGTGRQVDMKLDDGLGRLLARINDAAFFDKEVGHVSLPRVSPDGIHLLVRLSQRVPASYRELDEVKKDVVRYLASRRAWAKLYAAAEELRAAAEAGGGLAAYCSDEVLKPWGAKVTDRTVAVLDQLDVPAEEIDGFGGDAKIAFDLVRDPKPVVLLQASPLGDVPRITVAQASAYEPAEVSEEQLAYYAQQYRGQIASYMGQLLDQKLRAEQE